MEVATAKESINDPEAVIITGHFSTLRSLHSEVPFTSDAKVNLVEWFNAAIQNETEADRWKISSFRFFKKQLTSLLKLCAVLSEELPDDFGACTSVEIWNRLSQDPQFSWESMPHSLSDDELRGPVKILQLFFDDLSLPDWLEILETFDDATVAYNCDFFEGFEHNNKIFFIRDQLTKLLDASFLVLMASPAGITSDNIS